MGQYILAASLGLQLVAAALAIALIPATRALWAWILIAGALVLMTGRRAITLAAVVSGRAEADVSAELVALTISVAMVAGMALIRPVFTRLRDLADALAQREQNLSAIIGSAPDGIALVRDGRLAYANAALRHLLGADPTQTGAEQTLADLVHPSDRAEFEASLRASWADDHVGTAREVRFQTASGSHLPIELVYGPSVFHEGASARLLQLRDLSERKRLEEQMAEATKLEAIGRLSGGIAHDFNNILTVIVTAAALARERFAKGVHSEELDAIDEASARASRLTAQLLAYSRAQPVSPSVFDLNRLVASMGEMLRPIVGEDVRVELALCDGVLPVHADQGQIEQVVMNLVVNARDAMPSGGVLTIRTERGPVPTGDGDAAAEPAGMLAVSDDGEGMPPEVKALIFEPFFTTKPVGKGTGLGLSSSYGIVKRAGGHIEVDSTPGAGTTFRVSLPGASATLIRVEEREPARGRGGAERILLVEDERELARFAASALRAEGYEVDVAHSAEAALEFLAASGRAPDLLLTDVIMPGLDGPQLAERASQRFPGLRVLFMTGYGKHVVQQAGQGAAAEVLQKPFTPKELAAAVRNTLERALLA